MRRRPNPNPNPWRSELDCTTEECFRETCNGRRCPRAMTPPLPCASDSSEESWSLSQTKVVESLPMTRVARMIYPPGRTLPREWKPAVDMSTTYQASCFTYCAAGGLLLLRPDPVELHLPMFPWRTTGLLVVANGFISFMADVVTWGERSAWKIADILIASTNTCLQALIVVLSAAGFSSFPYPPVVALAVGLLLSLASRFMAKEAVKINDCHGFLFWHSWWHFWLPAGAIVGQMLLYDSCDWLDECPCTL